MFQFLCMFYVKWYQPKLHMDSFSKDKLYHKVMLFWKLVAVHGDHQLEIMDYPLFFNHCIMNASVCWFCISVSSNMYVANICLTQRQCSATPCLHPHPSPQWSCWPAAVLSLPPCVLGELRPAVPSCLGSWYPPADNTNTATNTYEGSGGTNLRHDVI